jgi:transketolase
MVGWRNNWKNIQMNDEDKKIEEIRETAKRMRKHAIKMGFSAGSIGAHFGSGLSIIDITAVLYCGIMNIDPKNPVNGLRDRFILSKGHGALGLYTALNAVGIISEDELYTYEKPEGSFPGQPQMNIEKGIEFSSGSLGHGLSYGIGLALIQKEEKRSNRIFVLMGDGECNEGSVWEAALAAGYYNLDNLIAIIDRNKLQSDGPTKDIMDMGDLKKKWESFNWNVVEVDGHDVAQLYKTFLSIRSEKKPVVVIAETIKGKGISFMENNNEWHHNRLTQIQFDIAMTELEKN